MKNQALSHARKHEEFIMFKGLNPVTFMVIFCMVFSFTVAQAALTGSNTVSIVASDDACISEAEPSTDQNETVNGLKVVNLPSTGFRDYMSYLRFDVSAIKSAIRTNSVFLELYVITKGSENVSVYAVPDGAAGETNWTSSMVWNNAPYTAPLASALVTMAPTNTGALMRFDLTSGFPGLINADSNGQVTLFLIPPSNQAYSGATTFASRSNTNGYPKPTLVVSADFGPPKGAVLYFR